MAGTATARDVGATTARHQGEGGGEAPDGEARAQQRLARELARHCRGRVGIAGPMAADLPRALEARGLPCSALEGDEGAARFDTVLVIGTLEEMERGPAAALLQRLWRRLEPDGRLLVCVPHLDLDDVRRVQRFSPRRLRRLLRPFGRPGRATGQPFRWLVMFVDRRTRHSAGVRERYRVIAARCRGAVIELGCGSGELSATIAARGLSCLGLDMNADKIAEARHWYPDLDFHCADILGPWDDPRRFDTVVLAEVLEHVEAETGERMLDRAWELVAPGGQLIVSVPHEDCVPHPNHLREFTRSSLDELLRRFGPPELVTDQPYRYLLMTVAKQA